MPAKIKVISGPLESKPFMNTAATVNRPRRFVTLTFGCQMNENDSERLSGQLRSLGYEVSHNLEQADVILLNTCCVRESAEQKIYGKIGELKRLKARNPDLTIIIAGCMAQKDKEVIFQRAPHVDIVMGTYNTHQLLDLLQEVDLSRERVLAVWEQAEMLTKDVPTVRKNRLSAWVPIMYGCNNFCTYCIVPYVRGRERSRPLDEILREVRQLGSEGYREITLLGQNVNSYGRDNGDVTFADLLHAVDTIDSIARVRFMTSHPRYMSSDVIAAIAGSRRICHHIHLPVQSGSDEILRRMNRGYDTARYHELAARIRAAIPDVCLTTDIIVGFPGETESLFQETIDFLKAVRFDAAYTFLYSVRSGTPAAAMNQQVPQADKKQRLQQLMDVQNDISLDINRRLVGRTLTVLVEGPSKNDPLRWTGRTDGNKIVSWDKQESEQIGDLIPIEITQAQTWVLKGRLV